MIYFIIFILTSILFYLAEKSKFKVVFNIISYLAIIILSTFAGVRDITVGTDILIYGIDTFNVARFFRDLFHSFSIVAHKSDFLFYLINYIVATFTDEYNILLFAISFIQNSLVFEACKKYYPPAPIWIMMLIYMLFFYNLTLNLMRQGLAMAFTLWSMKFFRQEKLRELIICAIIAFLLHKSSLVVYFVIFAVYWAYKQPERARARILRVEVIAAAVGVVGFGFIIKMISANIPLLSKFSRYGNDSDFASGVSSMDVLLRIMMFCVSFVLKKEENVKTVYILNMFLVADLAGQFLGIYAYYTTRITFYFLLIEIPYLVSIIHSNHIKKGTSVIIVSIIIGYLSVYCYRFNILERNNETYPYTSKIIHIE